MLPLIVSTVALQTPGDFDFNLEAGDWFGWALAEVGDQNGDGRAELAVGCPVVYDSNELARVWIFDGATGAVLAELGTREEDDCVGGWVANAGDVDLDGRDDVLFLSRKNRVELSSLVRGPLFEFESPTWHYREGPMLGSPGDVDDDGVRDVLVGATLHSGCDGRTLRDYVALVPVLAKGFDSVSIVPDVDDDGVADLGFVVLDVNCTHVVVVSAKEGKELARTRPISEPSTTFVPRADGTYERVEKGEERLRVRVVPGWLHEVDGSRELLMHARGEAGWPEYIATVPLDSRRTATPLLSGSGDREVPWVGRSSSASATEALVSTSMFAILRRIELANGRVVWETGLDDFAGHAAWGRVETVCPIGDLDADGVVDFACGVLQTDSPGLPGHVSVVSGRDGVCLRSLSTRDALLQVGKRR